MGNNTIYDEMGIHSCDMPTMSNACVSWVGGLNKKYLVKKLTKVQRLACLMISSAFPGTSTGAPEILLNITPILRNFYWLRQCESHTESLLVGSGMSTQLVPLGKQKPCWCLQWGKEILTSTANASWPNKENKAIERNFECQIMDKKNAIRLKAF